MAERAQKSIVVHAAPEKLYSVIVDYERYPEFLDTIKRARLVRRDERSAEVEFEAALLGKRIPYTLHFDENPNKGIQWRLVGGGFLKENNGSWCLRADGDARTHATYTLEIKVGLFIPKAVSTALAGAELPKVLEAFKRRAERV